MKAGQTRLSQPAESAIGRISGNVSSNARRILRNLSTTISQFLPVFAGGDLKVKPGDVLDIPAGMVQALTAGIVIYEVQQNSDTTYRLYDWDRVDAVTGKPRELHIEAALRVI